MKICLCACTCFVLGFFAAVLKIFHTWFSMDCNLPLDGHLSILYSANHGCCLKLSDANTTLSYVWPYSHVTRSGPLRTQEERFIFIIGMLVHGTRWELPISAAHSLVILSRLLRLIELGHNVTTACTWCADTWMISDWSLRVQCNEFNVVQDNGTRQIIYYYQLLIPTCMAHCYLHLTVSLVLITDDY